MVRWCAIPCGAVALTNSNNGPTWGVGTILNCVIFIWHYLGQPIQAVAAPGGGGVPGVLAPLGQAPRTTKIDLYK